MAGVVLSLRTPPPWPVDLSSLLPTALAGQAAAAIARLPLGRRLAVGDLFDVRAGDAPELTIAGASPLLERIGAGMTAGKLLVEGDAGAFAAAGLRGGWVEIRGNAGPCVGGVAPAGRIGMAGGVVVVRGAAGERAGDRMRRGLLVIEGAAGPHAASRMIAGTAVICGTVGASPGILMRRGTLLLGTPPAAAPPGFVLAGLAADGVFLRLLARLLRPVSARAAACAEAVQGRALGDLASLGKGEILLAAAPSGIAD